MPPEKINIGNIAVSTKPNTSEVPRDMFTFIIFPANIEPSAKIIQGIRNPSAKV